MCWLYYTLESVYVGLFTCWVYVMRARAYKCIFIRTMAVRVCVCVSCANTFDPTDYQRAGADTIHPSRSVALLCVGGRRRWLPAFILCVRPSDEHCAPALRRTTSGHGVDGGGGDDDDDVHVRIACAMPTESILDCACVCVCFVSILNICILCTILGFMFCAKVFAFLRIIDNFCFEYIS